MSNYKEISASLWLIKTIFISPFDTKQLKKIHKKAWNIFKIHFSQDFSTLKHSLVCVHMKLNLISMKLKLLSFSLQFDTKSSLLWDEMKRELRNFQTTNWIRFVSNENRVSALELLLHFFPNQQNSRIRSNTKN